MGSAGRKGPPCGGRQVRLVQDVGLGHHGSSSDSGGEIYVGSIGGAAKPPFRALNQPLCREPIPSNFPAKMPVAIPQKGDVDFDPFQYRMRERCHSPRGLLLLIRLFFCRILHPFLARKMCAVGLAQTNTRGKSVVAHH